MKDCQVEKVKRGTSGEVKCQYCGALNKYIELNTAKIKHCDCNNVVIYFIPKD